MTFPESPREIYTQNPLVEVICQLKFAPILKIETEPPAAFQELLRKEYPLMQEAVVGQILFPPEVMKAFRDTVPALMQGRAYHFASSDEVWKIALTRDFIALSATHYTRWEEFRSRLEVILKALVDVYAPAFFVRVGLRYRDVIRKSMEGLQELNWADLLQPHILGELGAPNIANAVQHTAREVVISLDNGLGQVRVLHGLIRQAGDTDFSYSIDSDFFSEGRTELNDVFRVLDLFNREAGRLFRWCTTPLLHRRLGASELP
jgi:uncharacterized protein (TIGR04255 family)